MKAKNPNELEALAATTAVDVNSHCVLEQLALANVAGYSSCYCGQLE
jgi:hypothetical protein